MLAQTEVDKTGKSYYGETTLYLLSANGGFDSRIDLDKDGAIHDVTWSPKSNSFAVVYGYMPSKTVIFNKRAEPVHTFPLKPRNTVLFSPHGRFVLVAGFGNLAGEMDIYDLEKDYAKVCTIDASNASTCNWAPDGRHILTAITSPRLRVDNGIRIWHASGQLMYNEDMNELYTVCWRPQPSSTYPLDANSLANVPAPHVSAADHLATKKTPSKPVGAYRPPGARGQITPLAFRREDEGGAAYVRDGTSAFTSNVASFGKPRVRVVPGAEPVDQKPTVASGEPTTPEINGEPMSKSAKKNAKKREAKKAAAAGEDSLTNNAPNGRANSKSPNRQRSSRVDGTVATLGPDVPTGPRSGRSRSASRRQPPAAPNGHAIRPSKQKSVLIDTTAPPSIQAPTVQVTNPDTPEASNDPNEKKIRGLLKKIRAIDDLKMRHAGGEKLEDTQVKKISSEDAVRKELLALGYTG